MSFWSKISENKIAVLATAGVLLGGAFFWYPFRWLRAYRQYENEEEDKVESGVLKS